MKIIFINRFFYPDHSATSQVLTDLAFELVAQGENIDVVTSRQRYDDPKANLSSKETKNGVRINRVWTTCFGRTKLLGRALDYLTFYISVAWFLMRILRRGDIVVAKTDPPLISVVAMVAAKSRGAVLVNWIQDLFPEVAVTLKVRGISGFFSSFSQKLRNVSLKASRMNVVIGEKMAARLVEEGINPGQIKVIHNWADGGELRPIPIGDNKLRDEWGLSGKFVIGYSGNMGRPHEFETILGAAEKLKDKKDLVFLFIGGGQKRRWIEEEARKRGLSNVIFKPYQSQSLLSESLSAVDVHLISLLPELEGLIVPSKFYGIAAVGRPAIFIGDLAGEIAQILSKEECGLSVAVGQFEALANQIRTLADDRDLTNRLGQNARAAFERRFDKALALQAWKEILLI